MAPDAKPARAVPDRARVSKAFQGPCEELSTPGTKPTAHSPKPPAAAEAQPSNPVPQRSRTRPRNAAGKAAAKKAEPSQPEPPKPEPPKPAEPSTVLALVAEPQQPQHAPVVKNLESEFAKVVDDSGFPETQRDDEPGHGMVLSNPSSPNRDLKKIKKAETDEPMLSVLGLH